MQPCHPDCYYLLPEYGVHASGCPNRVDPAYRVLRGPVSNPGAAMVARVVVGVLTVIVVVGLLL